MTSPSVTGFSAFSSAISRQMWIDDSGNVGYYFRQVSVAGAPNIELIKVDITSPTILGTGAPFPIGAGPSFYISSAFAPVGGYPLTSKAWVAGTDSLGNKKIYSFSTSTLAQVDAVTVLDQGGASVQAMTADGVTYASYNAAGTGIFLFNTSTHLYASYLFAAIGGPSNNINLIFDAANKLWAYGDDGMFYAWQVTPGSPPTIGLAASYATAGPLSPGQVDYNPSTDTVTGWALSGVGTDYSVIPINATSHTVGTINNLSSNWSSVFPDFGAPQTRIWGTSDYVGVVNADGGGNGAIVGVYQRSTGITTYYPWSYWGRSEPTGIVLSNIAVAQGGATILGMTGITPSSVGDGFEDWLFAFGTGAALTFTQGMVFG